MTVPFDLKAIAAGFRTVLEQHLPDSRVYAQRTGDIVVPKQGVAIVVRSVDQRDDVYHQAFAKGLVWWALELDCYVFAATTAAAVDRLYELMSAGTGQTHALIDALYTDRQLDGTVSDLKLTTVSAVESRAIADNGPVLPSVTFGVSVYTPRS